MAEIVPTRSHTDSAVTEKHKSRRSFRSGTQSTHHRRRQHAKETVQSAIELRSPITFDNILRRDKKDSDSSRRDSSTLQQQPVDGALDSPSQQARPKPVTPADLAKAKRENARREEDLRKSLKEVEEVGMSSTRQLDDTYYTILEKASILRSTVASLQQLADESRRMHAAFQEDTRKIEEDAKQNMQSFGNFDQQEKTISELVSKLEGSRERTEELNQRLESARLRVEAYEEHENAKAGRRRKQLHAMWMSLVAIGVLVAAIVLAKHRRAVGQKLSAVNQQLAGFGDTMNEVIGSPLASILRPTPSEDPYLQKLFDDL